MVFLVEVKHVLHPSHELPTHFGNAPLLPLPRLEFVFFSIWRTVSGEMLSENPIATTLPASSRSDHRVCPSGAALQVMATRCASCLLLNLRFCPGRGRSLSALSSPSFTNRVRTRPTVGALINSPLAISRSVRPSSAFNNTSARLTLRADDFPRRTTSLDCDRSDSLNSTLYLRAGMSSYILLIKSYARLTYFLYCDKYTWNLY